MKTDYYNRNRGYSYKAVFYGMIAIMILLLFCGVTASAEIFHSHETLMMTKDSTDIKTKKIFWWSDWSKILPNDGSHLDIEVKKRLVIMQGDTYTLDKTTKRTPAYYKHENSAIFVYNATDQNNQKWTITICRTNRIVYILKENENKMILYQ